MKLTLIVFMIMCAVNLSAQNKVTPNDSAVVYILPGHVGSTLANLLDSNSYFFYLGGDFDHLVIRAVKTNNDNLLTGWLRCTNRFILLNLNFYPILFETDERFGAIGIGHFGKMRRLNRRWLSRKYTTAIIQFNHSGSIISSSVKK
jgi:hypothetical protein